MNAKNVIVVDGANVAYVETSEEGQPKVSNLMAVRRTLEQKGYAPLIIVDASLRHSIVEVGALAAEEETTRRFKMRPEEEGSFTIHAYLCDGGRRIGHEMDYVYVLQP